MNIRLRIWQPFLLINMLALSTYAQPVANFSGSPVAGCSPLIVNFSDLSSGNPTSWLWNLGNGNTSTAQNPSAIYVNPGFYTITLTASNAAGSNTTTKTSYIQVFNNPVANFSVSALNGCIPFTTSFTDLSTSIDGTVNTWTWDFGDGTTSNAQNPTHTYNTAGVFSVSLIVQDVNSCQDDTLFTNLITVDYAPVAGFSTTGSYSCSIPFTVNFTNTSSGNITAYNWSFGDGNTSTAINPSHTYSSYGTFPVALSVTNNLGCVDIFRDTIIVEPFVAAFSANLTQICQGDAVQFTDFSGPNAAMWTWDFGDGGGSTVANPLHVFNTAGDFTVSLISNSNACPDTLIKTNLIHVAPHPLVDFTTADTFSCSLPYTVNFTNLTTNGVSWLWDFGDGTTSTLQNPVHTYTTEGSFTVSLTAIGANGCPAVLTKLNYIVTDIPVANFYAFPINHGCIPFTVQFLDSTQSTDPVISWQWDLGDGTFANTQNPVHVYTNPGTYNISLIITTSGGCIDTFIRPAYIQVGTPPLPAFTWTPDTQCVHQNIVFTDSSTNTLSWQWDFGDGQTDTARNPIHAYGDTGTYTVTLTVSNMGCDSVLVMPKIITIIGPVAQFSDSVNCQNPLSVFFTDRTINPHQTWWWDFGDGTFDSIANPTHIYPAFGTYTVMLVVTDSITTCPDTFTNQVVIPNLSVAFNASPVFGCNPMPVTFSNLSVDAMSYLWDFGDGSTDSTANPTHVYTSPGIYSVKLVVKDVNGCSDSLIKLNYIQITDVQAAFTALNRAGCMPLQVSFQDTSSSLTGNVNTWLWNFGDGSSSTLQNPVHTFSNPGNYSVQLTVSDNNGCTNTLVKPAYVYVAQPVALLSVDSFACLGVPVQFTNLSSGDGLSYLWDFGDGSTSTQQHPLHTYNAFGIYTIGLTVTDSNGCTASLILPNRISVQQLIAGFTANPTSAACPPLTVYFTDISSGNITNWFWDFGDGSSSALQNPAHTYTVPGIYTVKLIVSTHSSCSDTFTINNLINLSGPIGSFTFTPDKGCIPLTTTFIASSPNTVSYTWDFGDGTIIFLGNDTIQHTYLDTGYHYPILILDDGLGCTRSIVSDSPVVADLVTADFTASTQTICTAGYVNFTPLVQSVGAPASYFWNFGDGTVSTLQSPTHYYSTAGYYNVMLIVESVVGCSDTVVKPQYIHVISLQAAFTGDSLGCGMPFNAQYTDQSSSNDVIAAYTWDFGDGTQSNVANPSHSFVNPAYYTVKLYIQTQEGCIDSSSLQVVIGAQPIAGFLSADVCVSDTAFFTDNSSITSGSINNWAWAFGDGNTGTGQQTAHLYSSAGQFTATLSVSSDMGCIDSVSKSISIHALPQPMAQGDTAICIGQASYLHAFNGINYQWSPALSLDQANIANPLAHPLVSTQYVVLVSDANGCSNTDTVNIMVNNLPQTVVSPDKTLCFGDSTQLLASGGIQYAWQPVQSLSCSSCPDPLAGPQMTTLFTVVITDSNGCVQSDSTLLSVLPLPVLNMSADTLICIGDTINLQSNSTGINYQWTPGSSLSCASCASTNAYPATNTVYSFQVTAVNGCMNQDSINVQVSNIPEAQAGKDKSICAGEQIQLHGQGGTYYSWLPVNGLSCSNCPDPKASPNNSTQYIVNVSNGHCASTDTIFVEVKQKVNAVAGPDTAICLGNGLQLYATADSTSNGNPQYSWSPASTLSDSQIPDPFAEPLQNIIYTLTVSNGLCQPAVELVHVDVHNLPAVDAGPDQVIFTGMNTTLNATVLGTAPVNYDWIPSTGLNCSTCEDPVASPASTTVYTLSATDANGCRMKDSATVTVIDGCAEALIFVPNTFTPNGDGRNDKLFVRTYGIQAINFFKVFDRWGKMVFETTNINDGWDGTYLGTPLNPGVFVYEVQGICLNNQVFVKSGNVSIVK